MEVITKSAKETKRLGQEYGADLVKTSKRSVVLALSGDLGSGKTTFVQGLAKGLGIKKRVISPTFILMRTYAVKKGVFYHIDLYRLDKDAENELLNLGFEEIIADRESIIAIEWAEKVKNILPKNTIWMEFEYLGKDKRKIIINK